MIVRTGTQIMTLCSSTLSESGSIEVETSNTVNINGIMMYNSYTSGIGIKYAASSNGVINGNSITYSAVVSSLAGLFIQGANLVINGNFISKADYGIYTAQVGGTIAANFIADCGTAGVQLLSGSDKTVLGINSFSGNLNDIANAAGGPNLVVFNYATTKSDAANNGTFFGNAPAGYYKRDLAKGATGSRPTLTSLMMGTQYLDTTLDADGKLITWNGTAWVDATGATV
jgi:hypothetical protein